MAKRLLQDGSETFEVTVLEATKPSRIVLFAVGGGGNPERHLPLLARLVRSGCTVIAPHFDRLKSQAQRCPRLRFCTTRVGGGRSGSFNRSYDAARPCWWPSVDEFRGASIQAPHALDAVSTPILAWAGTNDTITPPRQAEFLRHALGARLPVEVRVVRDAGHFSFMNTPPPETKETPPNREDFLTNLAEELCCFVAS